MRPGFMTSVMVITLCLAGFSAALPAGGGLTRKAPRPPPPPRKPRPSPPSPYPPAAPSDYWTECNDCFWWGVDYGEGVRSRTDYNLSSRACDLAVEWFGPRMDRLLSAAGARLTRNFTGPAPGQALCERLQVMVCGSYEFDQDGMYDRLSEAVGRLVRDWWTMLSIWECSEAAQGVNFIMEPTGMCMIPPPLLYKCR